MKSFFKHFKLVSLSVLLVFNLLIFYSVFANQNGVLKIVFLDVGQGDSILIQSPLGNQMLIDGGPNKKVLESLGEIIPFYDRFIDAVIATHPDADHIAGLPEVLKNYKISNYFDSGDEGETKIAKELQFGIKENNVHYEKIKTGSLVDLGGGAYLRILSPVGDLQSKDTNTDSIVAKLYFGDTSVLLTGDAPEEIEDDLAKKYGAELKSQILKVAHHGSKNSLSDSFISAVQPDYSVISVGEDNRYGHPHKEVLDFLGIIETKILKTFETGNIVFESDGYNLKEVK